MNIFKKPMVKDVITNAIYLILIVIYFVCFNTQVMTLDSERMNQYIHISCLTFLVIGIVMFEVGYRNDKSKIFINGVEFSVLATLTLFIKHIPKTFGYTIEHYTLIIIYAFIAYYIIKSAVIYTKLRYDKLKSLSDIKEIVKEEPIKKETKRKNKKVEEGK